MLRPRTGSAPPLRASLHVTSASDPLWTLCPPHLVKESKRPLEVPAGSASAWWGWGASAGSGGLRQGEECVRRGGASRQPWRWGSAARCQVRGISGRSEVAGKEDGRGWEERWIWGGGHLTTGQGVVTGKSFEDLWNKSVHLTLTCVFSPGAASSLGGGRRPGGCYGPQPPVRAGDEGR